MIGFTVNGGDEVVEAVAVADGKILAVGGDGDVARLADHRTRVVDLRGRSLLPGFIDAHCHLASLGLARASIDCKAPGMQSISALRAAVRERAQRQAPGTWIRGRGYDQSRLAERRHPTRDVCGPEERVDLATAIRMHTINGAWAAFEDHLKGSLEPGKLADLVMLDEDLSRVPAERIRHVGVAMTVVGGEVVYERS